MKTAVTLADHVYVMGRGMLVEQGTPRQLLRGEGVKGSVEMSFRKKKKSVSGTSAFRHMYEMQCGHDEILQKIDKGLADERNGGDGDKKDGATDNDKKDGGEKEERKEEASGGEDKFMPLPSHPPSGGGRGSLAGPARRSSLNHTHKAKRRQSMKVLNMMSTIGLLDDEEEKKDGAVAAKREGVKAPGRRGSAAMMMAGFQMRKGASFKAKASGGKGGTSVGGGSGGGGAEKKLRRPTKARGSFMAFMLPQNPAELLTKEIEEEQLAAHSVVENAYDDALDAVQTIDAVVTDGDDDWALSGDAAQENDALRAELVKLRAALAKHVAKSNTAVSQKLESARSEGSSKALLALSDVVLKEE